MTLKVKYADFQIVTRSRTLDRAGDGREELEQTSVELVRRIFPLGEAGFSAVWASSLSNMGPA